MSAIREVLAAIDDVRECREAASLASLPDARLARLMLLEDATQRFVVAFRAAVAQAGT